MGGDSEVKLTTSILLLKKGIFPEKIYPHFASSNDSKHSFEPFFTFLFFRQALNTSTTTKDKLLHLSYNFSSFLTVSLLFRSPFLA